jgi:hypothetical protein
LAEDQLFFTESPKGPNNVRSVLKDRRISPSCTVLEPSTISDRQRGAGTATKQVAGDARIPVAGATGG